MSPTLSAIVFSPGELHGFYFGGQDRLTIERMFTAQSYALDASGRRYGLETTRLADNRWDIILANGQGVSQGHVTYMFFFRTDFSSAGYLASTTTADGRTLAVFNWAPHNGTRPARWTTIP